MAGEDNFISRWSRRKSEAKGPSRAQPEPQPASPAAVAPPVEAGPKPLLPPESLTTESDFAPFMAPGVDGDVRRQALKTLFSDPRHNVMDMMDVYVDDYSKPDPIPAEWMDQLQQLSRLGDRAGRDREEEEERRKALAEATGKEPAPASEAAPDGPAEAVAAAPDIPDTPPERGDALPVPQSPIPILPSGESGT